MRFVGFKVQVLRLLIPKLQIQGFVTTRATVRVAFRVCGLGRRNSIIKDLLSRFLQECYEACGLTISVGSKCGIPVWFRVQGARFAVQIRVLIKFQAVFRVQGLGCRVGLGFRV